MAADGLGYDFSLSSAFTDSLLPGILHYTIRAKSQDGTKVATIDIGETMVRPNPSIAVDSRSHNEKCLEDIRAAIQLRLQGTILNEYTIGGVTAKMPSLNELQRMEAYYKSAVKRDRGNPNQRAIPIRLAPARGGIVPFGFNRRPR